MQLLVLGGTRFLGRALVEDALARGHEVTLFNRGQTNPDLFPEAERVRGDRTEDLSALEGREWDAVLDVATFLPRVLAWNAEREWPPAEGLGLTPERERELLALA